MYNETFVKICAEHKAELNSIKPENRTSHKSVKEILTDVFCGISGITCIAFFCFALIL